MNLLDRLAIYVEYILGGYPVSSVIVLPTCLGFVLAFVYLVYVGGKKSHVLDK